MREFIKQLEFIFDMSEGSVLPQDQFKKYIFYDSLASFMVLDMINQKYSKTLTIEDIRKSNTVMDLYELTNS